MTPAPNVRAHREPPNRRFRPRAEPPPGGDAVQRKASQRAIHRFTIGTPPLYGLHSMYHFSCREREPRPLARTRRARECLANTPRLLGAATVPTPAPAGAASA